MPKEHLVPSAETSSKPDCELAGSLQGVLNNLSERDFSLDLQQTEALEAIGLALIEGVSSGYIEMATSTGKTTVEALLTEAAVKAGKRVLLLAPTLPIAKQIDGSESSSPTGLKRFAHLPENARVEQHFNGKKGNKNADVVVSTYAGLLNDAKSEHRKLGEFDVIIADECHRSLGKETSEVLRTVMPHAFKLGLSATPDYAVDRMSEEVYDRRLYEFSLRDAVESGRTSPVRAFLYETDETLVLNDPRREFTDKELAPLTHNLQRNGTAVALTKAFVEEGRQGIIACIPGRDNLHARLLADLLKTSGIRAADVGAHLDAETQARRLAAYHRGDFDVLTFTRALEEGWDSDRASFAINLAPTSSPVRTTQLLGRILRKKPDDLESIFVDFVDKKSGSRSKSQYTAMHALGLDTIDLTRVLGRPAEHTPAHSHSLKLLHVISPKIHKRLIESQGKLLRNVTVGKITDPLIAEWEATLEKEGLPAELSHNDALPPKLEKRVSKAYAKFYHDHGVAPSVDELIETMGKVSGPERNILGSFALRAELDQLVQLDLEDVANNDEISNPHQMAVGFHSRQQLHDTLDTLSEREAGVVMRRFGLHSRDQKGQIGGIGRVEGVDKEEPMELDEIGKVYGITKERVRQIESKALAKLRHPSRSESLRDYYEDHHIGDKEEPTIHETNRRNSGNPFIQQFTSFSLAAPLPDIPLVKRVKSEYEKTAYPWMSDDGEKTPFYWRAVADTRSRLGIKEPTYRAFWEREEQIDDAIRIVEGEIDRLNQTPVADHESSLGQRLATLDVYASRLAYLESLRDKLEELYQLLEDHHELRNTLDS
ncbi:hypothetical protein RAAC3_TM7C00001G0355 [Candidatus Saccharibacteria bacterium RAAC3_TM7_1]|nr:hypothetical protein RAAC3_TM7C00001G0355 [Candidatus Saccharibacteria bacterium RAAC3_TM7_1]HCZ28310.1 hypothetical protein [Candidatus Saccharibacteria bacterium]